MTHTVDVVVPTYDVEDFVAEAVLSAVNQSYPSSEISVIVVDDGSSDRTTEIVEEITREHSNVTLLRCEHTGSPSVPRNRGLEHGSGEFVFFLDGDDHLDPRALEGLVSAAVDQDADIVLGKMEGLNERSVPRSMFHETVLDADLVEHRLFYALGPTKLFRRSLIEEHGLRFPTDIRTGQDQPFVAEALLLARRVTILADRSYYYARLADDPTRHLSRSPQTASQIIHRTRRVADIIARYVEPGERRALLLRRPYGIDLYKAFAEPLLALDPADQEIAVAEASALLQEHGDALTFAPMNSRKRLVFELAKRGAHRALVDLHHHRTAQGERDLVSRGGGWHLDAPGSVVAAVGTAWLAVANPDTLCYLDGFSCHGDELAVAGWAGAVRGAAVPDVVTLELRERDGGRTLPVPITLGTPVEHERTHGTRFTATVDLASLPSAGMWDLWVSSETRGARSEPVPAGQKRSRAVATHDLECPSGLVHIGVGDGLSVDAGYTHLDRSAAITIVGLAHDMDGLAEVLIRHTGTPPEIFAELSPAGSRDARLLLPTRVLGPALLAARLPDAADGETCVRLSAANGRRLQQLSRSTERGLPGVAGAVTVTPDRDGYLIGARVRADAAAPRAQHVRHGLGSLGTASLRDLARRSRSRVVALIRGR